MKLLTIKAGLGGMMAAAALQASALPVPAANSRMHTLFTLPGQSYSGFVRYDGLLYGSNAACGSGSGCIFSFDPVSGQQTEVYRFSGGADGYGPVGGLVAVGKNLYGTTFMGGIYGNGVVFKLDPNTGIETVIHHFRNGTDAQNPFSRLIHYKGSLYGTTEYGGTSGQGAVFRVNLLAGTETVLHSFDYFNDGGEPVSGLTVLNGALYGTTYVGGAAGNGTLYTIDISTGILSVVHDFNTTDNNGNDGALPSSDLTAVDGLLYGTTTTGSGTSLNGTLFKFDPAIGAETVVHQFAGAADGSYPQFTAPLLVNGYLYGGTTQGGSDNRGTLYRFNLTTSEEMVIHNFTGSTDGAGPTADLLALQGCLYGTAGATVFSYSLLPAP